MQKQLADIKQGLFRIFNHLPNNPEISWKDYNATKFLKGLIEEQDLSVTSFSECTG